ncbi:1-acyl-sn-glycerol-3-phosphate acyltransferase [uncultured Microscilla sp.]|uniref:1-acyl-sn-glycerol-3-phosphate acyltransferase n=1 Tax=uncultured Microscilla sp. TaxID=432653 RepID=UPI00260C8A09|nr:1-acyl-sn-glycerol-3-phosphate acyltransferase [uncultured Microscilla sp.]
MSDQQKFIDIKRVIADKNPKLLKWTPGFVVKYLKNILHEDEINEVIENNKDKLNIEFCEEVIKHFNIQLTTQGLDNVPEKGGCILAINHPLGGMDAMAIVTLLKQKRTDIKFIVNDVLMNLVNLQGMFVGVNKHGKNVKESLRKVDELFATDQLICVFPAGLVSRKKKGEIRDLEWKKTFITRARKHQRLIIPTYIDGELSNFFYRLSNMRTKVGVKTNIEMLYLVNEMFKQRNKKMKVIFGKPIVSNDLDRKIKSDAEWAEEIKNKVYQLDR